MARWYVEMRKTVYCTGEVEAESAEDAEDQMLLEADGDPRDWTVTVVQPGAVGHAEVGAINLDG